MFPYIEQTFVVQSVSKKWTYPCPYEGYGKSKISILIIELKKKNFISLISLLFVTLCNMNLRNVALTSNFKGRLYINRPGNSQVMTEVT